jgi:hypothetical protein
MKTTRNALFALLLLAAGTVTAASAQVSIGAGLHIGPSGRASVDLGFFYDNLASYGNWIQRPSYGWVWTPNEVSTNWRPYEDGHWVWTDQGWTWITDEPYGWATYHYGRWYQDPEIGWAWVPGDEWGPSWVSWQEGDNYVGWAPLPPGVDISASYDAGYNGGYASYDYGIGPDAYVFVPEQYFLAPSIATYVVPTVQISAFWGRTRNYTSYRREGDRYFNQGVPVDRIQRVIGRSVPRYQIADLQTTDYRQPPEPRHAEPAGVRPATGQPRAAPAATAAGRPAAGPALSAADIQPAAAGPVPDPPAAPGESAAGPVPAAAVAPVQRPAALPAAAGGAEQPAASAAGRQSAAGPQPAAATAAGEPAATAAAAVPGEPLR